jgi:uncharacterized protein (DUF849 family)
MATRRPPTFDSARLSAPVDRDRRGGGAAEADAAIIHLHARNRDTGTAGSIAGAFLKIISSTARVDEHVRPAVKFAKAPLFIIAEEVRHQAPDQPNQFDVALALAL